ncbi:hypothetical protein F2Q69_00002477 [Brassica cretica]|uniref:TPR1-like CTLH-containing domain-containing protein n=1 Tax=Brassica cretica TaxID=69181 RepID=A0A8S9P6Q7_BRACR|nr:hypothetical protein F2Q69_00002477 [Brassica cretica]
MGDSTMILDETNRKNLIFLILQFLHEEGYEKSLHLLEQDSGAFFDYSYFSGFITNGKWKDAEDYLSAFTSPDTNTFSRKMFFDLYKWKFSEAPDRSGGSESANIFSNDLRRIPVFKDDGFEDLVELCVWSTKRWLKLTSIDSIQNFCTRLNNVSSLVTQIQFDPYQIELLVVQDKWISRHAAPTLDCLRQWVPDESEAAITSATYSSDGEIICVGFRSESIKILDSMTFLIKCRINLTAFTQPIPSNIRVKVYPAVVAAHPSLPSQISVGLSNGRVIVLQPLGRGGWGEADALEDDRDNSDGLEHCY